MVIGKCRDVFRGIFGWEGGGVEKRGLFGGNFPWRNLSWGKKISIKVAQHFLALFKKNNEKINMKKFFQLEVWSSLALKLKKNRKYYAYKGFTSS